MVTYISSWARQIILAVIVGIILEMILSPKSKNTKYIKTVIGIYVMYTIIVPVMNLINGEEIDFSNIDYEKYFTNTDIYMEMEENIKEVADNNFKESFELNLKQDIENKLNKKGFIVSSVKLQIELNEKSEEYGSIKEIKIGVSKKEKVNEEIVVNKVNIEEQEESNILSEKEENNIKEFLRQEYGTDNIIIL
jgi:stage III sporulation protein AF